MLPRSRSDGDVLVVLDLRVDQGLISAGAAREVVNRWAVQICPVSVLQCSACVFTVCAQCAMSQPVVNARLRACACCSLPHPGVPLHAASCTCFGFDPRHHQAPYVAGTSRARPHPAQTSQSSTNARAILHIVCSWAAHPRPPRARPATNRMLLVRHSIGFHPQVPEAAQEGGCDPPGPCRVLRGCGGGQRWVPLFWVCSYQLLPLGVPVMCWCACVHDGGP